MGPRGTGKTTSVSGTDERGEAGPAVDVGAAEAREKGARVRVFGALADREGATVFAEQVHALMRRYAAEVVAPFALCPHLHNVDTGLGAVGVVLEVEPTIEVAVGAIRALDANVVHLIYPLHAAGSSPFERFGNKLAEALRRALPEPLVHACFHPAMVGGKENAHRLIGLLRQAPDPFVQFIPPGMQGGGTVLAGYATSESRADTNYARLVPERIDALLATIESLKQERRALDPLAEQVART